MVSASKCAWVLALWLRLAMLQGSGAQVGAPSPSMDCTPALLSLADCLTFVEQGSNVTKPQGHCCSGFKKVVKKEVACLCEAFKGSSNFGISLNITKALTLPSACGVSTPPFSKCKTPSPSSGAPASSGSASTVPTPSPNSGARALSAPSFVVVLAAAAVALFQSI
ncbi:non-specific lipid transfer protein GPI-anchored 31 isoform X2 [Elaeis guineensis]|uniref:Non-specific lipid-transfer protein-like protein At5g64080 isoform X2 n=1 Tax=Elaeis guineensis var. tenera TaxID=51953 RepID=A0A6J0PF24_ELAGV|nr:non-specific lipid-transfer protein-like protein At5g64080 isoform X2 [Elaeis guineensis]